MMEFTFDGIVRLGFGFYNPNHAAALLCALFPFMWGWKKYALLGWGGTILLAIPLCLTYSRTGVAVLFFELAAYLILKRVKNWRFIAAISVGILLVLAFGGIFRRFTVDAAIINRLSIWLAGLQLYAANPFGVGLGNSGCVVSNFLLQDIQCRTLVNSHLTLLAEFGIFAGLIWGSMIFYALLRGIKKVRTWCAFAGLCLSASSTSIFDWDLLADFQAYGNLSRLNFFLSWLLLCLFLVLLAVLIRGRVDRKQLGIAVFLSCVCVIIPFALCNKQVPKIKDDIAITSPDAQLSLYDDTWGIKAILAYCNEEYRIPLQPGFKKLSASKLILFGYASDYADDYPESEIIYVHPPEFFSPSPNTIKIFLPFHDPREFPGNVEYR